MTTYQARKRRTRTPKKTVIPVRESLVVNAIIRWAHFRKDIFIYRQNTGGYYTPDGTYIAYGYPGSTDLIGLLAGGRLIGIECKSTKEDGSHGNQGPKQEAFQRRIEGLGGLYVLAYAIEDVARAMGVEA